MFESRFAEEALLKTRTALILLVLIAVAIGFHLYLAEHYYDLSFGQISEQSSCNINSKFNCDAVSASSFSSLLGVPIALWGAITNLVFFSIALLWFLGWSNDLARIRTFTLWLSGFIAAVSVVMGSISTVLIGTFCLYCIGTYVISFVAFALVLTTKEPGQREPLTYLKELFGPARSYLIFILAIPLAGFFFHRSYISKVGAADLPVIVKSSLAEWQTNPIVDLSTAKASIVSGPDDSKMVITEFADFRCGHCKQASQTLKAFLSSRPDVQMRFFNFPLDGACNEAIQRSDGISCWLAKATFCAETKGQAGQIVHDAIFAKQEEINKNTNLEFAKDAIRNTLEALNVPAAELNDCIASPETDTAIRAQAKAGRDAGISGTPTFFVNGRKLSRGQLLPVLEAVYKATR
jgi:protein-disulfide isomerase/uncharacterized membrane protein